MQGDLLPGVGVPVMPPDAAADPGTEVISERIAEYRNVVVLSQSCDLDHDKLAFVLVAPYLALEDAKQAYPVLRSSEKRESLRQGNQTGLHPLHKCDVKGLETDFLVVEFRRVFTVPIDYLLRRAAEPVLRARLLPPYREHLAQAYARFIMRVGLPVDIPKLP
jgi:hypothetical protein